MALKSNRTVALNEEEKQQGNLTRIDSLKKFLNFAPT